MTTVNRGITDVEQEMRRRVDKWVENKEIKTLAITRHYTDPNSRLINFGGALKIPLHQGWKPPVGSEQDVVILKTRNGAFYAMPADIKKLPAGEFNKDRQMTFTAILRKGRKGYYFRMDSGLILVPPDQAFWQEQDVLHKNALVGRTIELTGWAKSTCYVVVPTHENVLGSIAIDINVNDRVAAKEQARKEAAYGIIRIAIETEKDGIKNATNIPILATTVLGMTRDSRLTDINIDKSKKLAFKQYKDVGSGKEKNIVIDGMEIEASVYITAIGEAVKVLKELVGKGVKCLADLYADSQVEQIAAVEESDLLGEEVFNITCQNCGATIEVSNLNYEWADTVTCPACQTDTGPLLNCSTRIASQPWQKHSGVAENWFIKLDENGIKTIEQLAKETKEHLMEILGLGVPRIPNKMLKAARTICP